MVSQAPDRQSGGVNDQETDGKRKGCATCLRRRIRCDQTLPSCRKCERKGLTCPGYERRLRWAGAIAVRGRFRGIAEPRQLHGTGASHEHIVIGPSHVRGKEISSEQVAKWSDVAVDIARLVPGALTTAEICGMVHYYHDRIAGNMVWIDSPSNPYKRLVIPRARSQPILLLAILTIASEHDAMSRKASSSMFSKNAHDIVISHITRELERTVNMMSSSGAAVSLELHTVEWILASILVLSNYECIGSQSMLWCSHRLGARTLIHAVSISRSETSELYQFLRAQFSTIDILASTTTRLHMNSQDVVLQESNDPEAILSEYMKLIHEINTYTWKGETNTSQIPPASVLRTKFETVRGLTMMNAAASPALADDSTRLHFILLADVFHTAALLFAYRTACRLKPEDPAVQVLSKELMEKLDHFIANVPLIQTLPWPVLIAGIESHGLEERQVLVSKWYQAIIEGTGFNNYKEVELFLVEYWAGNEKNWRKMAELWERQGRPVLAV
ncbi:hypothetical protein PFICI_05471 [Pestalotiopsis fici W106-1]|uniref:Zn(2)-C6 fungal-type domain-containing protein n=1 Tax=Pestalotiopsis fici (strain W106-1 / CGMCC3.15140) TaxID=1229662 RepID=W3XC21_PESFW|nr:uncharacterized protein PFICI_05471 [Pestalotiopsis fici W106-1]ETS83595.1 hypothetical protein PFICI_05471 [Pestalotiopsis fici W106-1]